MVAGYGLNSARYKKKQGVLTLRLSTDLVPYLLQLSKCFTKINISDSLKLKSIYACRIYDLLVQHKNIGNRKITIEELRAWCGFEENEYVLYSNLKKMLLIELKAKSTPKQTIS